MVWVRAVMTGGVAVPGRPEGEVPLREVLVLPREAPLLPRGCRFPGLPSGGRRCDVGRTAPPVFLPRVRPVVVDCFILVVLID